MNHCNLIQYYVLYKERILYVIIFINIDWVHYKQYAILD